MQRNVNPRVGDVWDVEFDPVVGHEQGGRRPALIISNDEFNDTPHGLCIVAPFTTTDRGVRAHVRVEPPEGGLARRSVIMPEQAKSASVLRVWKFRGRVSPDTLVQVQKAVGLFIDRP